MAVSILPRSRILGPESRHRAKRKRFYHLSLSFPNGKKVRRPAPDGCGRVAALTGC